MPQSVADGSAPPSVAPVVALYARREPLATPTAVGRKRILATKIVAEGIKANSALFQREFTFSTAAADSVLRGQLG